MADGDILYARGALTPARHALKFIATGDEAALIDEFAVARVAANDTEGTFTAWVNIPDKTGDYAIVSCGDTAAIEFLTLRVTAGKLVIECNDATVDQFEHTSTNIVITPHKWHHVAVTQTATLEAPKLYVDGVKVAQTATLATDNGTWFSDLNLTDDGSIGAGEEAGAAAQIREYKGGISDVKYWTVPLTPAQIKKDYQGQAPDTITGTSGDLTDWWEMKDLTNSVTAANAITLGASILFVNGYSEFTSKMAFLGAVIDDDITIAMTDKTGLCVVLKAA